MPDWSAPPDGHRIAALNIALFSSHVARGENVGEKEHLLVSQSILNLDCADVLERDANIFGLATRESTCEM